MTNKKKKSASLKKSNKKISPEKIQKNYLPLYIGGGVIVIILIIIAMSSNNAPQDLPSPESCATFSSADTVATCESMQSEYCRSGCFFALAEFRNDASLCERITITEPADYRFICTASITNSQMFCEGETGEKKDLCYYLLAGKNRDAEYCTPIAEPEAKEACIAMLGT